MKTQLIALGAVALLAQVALLRELSVAFFGSELILILALGIWLLAVGTGAVALRARRRTPPTPTHISRWFAATAVILALALVVVRNLRPLMGALPGAYPALGGMLLAVPVIMFPVAVPLGRLFRDLAGIYAHRGGTLAGAYALESSGSLLGGAVATMLLLLGAPNLIVLWLAAVTAAVCGWWSCGPGSQRRLVGIPALVLLVAGPWLGGLDARLTALVQPDLLAVRDTPYGRLTLLHRGEQKVVLVNDALVYEDQGTATEELVHLAALQVDRPDSILVLGGSARGVIAGLLQHGPSRVTGVELSRRGFQLERRLLGPADTDGLDDPRVRIVYGDPRSRLQRGDARFDLILIHMPQPDSGLSNRYYTREFFALCAAHLSPGGVLAFALQSAENYWTPLLVRRNASILEALRESLPVVAILPGTTNVVLASRQPLPGPDELGKRCTSRGIRARLLGPSYIHYLYTNDRRQEIADQLAAMHPPPNTDLHPVCYQYSLALWLSRFHRQLADSRWLGWTPGAGTRTAAVGLILLLALLALLGRRRWRAAGGGSLWIVLGAGWYGMLLESVLVLAYQTTSGVLYRDLGILLTLFMAGLTAGAWWCDHKSGSAHRIRSLRLVLVLSVLPVVLTVVLLLGGARSGLAITSLLLLAAGGVTGGLFALVAAARNRDFTADLGPVYAADLLGGSLASVSGSLVLMPLLGLGATAVVAVIPLLLLLLAL